MDARQLAQRLAGSFIVFDGPDGGGKSTQIALLAAHLADDGAAVEIVADPGTTAIGQKIRALLLERHDMAIAPMCEVMLFMASRAQLVAERVRPAVAAGKVVLCDRFISATLAYQGALGVSAKTIIELGEIAIGGLWPDLTIVLDLPSQAGLERAGGRAAQADRLESRELAYHQRVRDLFAEIWKDYPAKVCYVDAAGDKQAVLGSVLAELEKWAATREGMGRP